MKKFEIGIIILCSLFLFNCAHKPEIITLKKGTAIIAGKVENWKTGSKTIRFAAVGTINKIEQTVIIDSSGKFNTKIEVYHPQNVNMHYENGFVQLYIQSSDSFYLELDAKKFKTERFPTFNISGLGEDVMTSENIRDYLHFQGENSFNPVAKNKSVDEFTFVLKQEILRKDSILQQFCNKNKTTSEFRNWANSDIKYGVANYIIQYSFDNRNIDYQGNLFNKTLFPVNNDSAIITSLYGYHLRHYALNLGIWQDSISMNLLNKKEYLAANTRCLDKIVSNEKKGLSRDIMCYKIMLSLFNDSFEDFTTILGNIENYIENQFLIDVLLANRKEFEKQKENDISYLDPIKNEEREITGDFWKELKNQYKGKVVYIDIWATWCAPCRGEIPYSIELHEHFKGKDIAFINLCLASNKPEWQKMIKNSNIKGYNYFFNKPQTQLLREKLKFEGYPTYLIIDKKGNLINKNAPRPSSGEEIKGILDKLEKEQTSHNKGS